MKKRVVARYWERRIATLSSVFDAYSKSVSAFEAQLEMTDNKYILKRYWWIMITAGVNLVREVSAVKAIPRGSAKKYEMASRLFLSARGVPRNFKKWADKNQKHINFLWSVKTWEDKGEASEDSADVFPVGPFTVHNSLMVEGQKLDNTKKLILQAYNAMNKAPVPGLKKALYGDIFIVGKLMKRSILAWYFKDRDDISVRPHLKVGQGEVHNLCHEVGHRYWMKFVSAKNKSLWVDYHRAVGRRSPDVVMPEIGDSVPVKIPKVKGFPTVSRIEGDKYFFEEVTDGYFTYRSIYRAMAKESVIAEYPSRYASTDAEEHFCEALAMYVLGTLPLGHKEKFEEIFI